MPPRSIGLPSASVITGYGSLDSAGVGSAGVSTGVSTGASVAAGVGSPAGGFAGVFPPHAAMLIAMEAAIMIGIAFEFSNFLLIHSSLIVYEDLLFLQRPAGPCFTSLLPHAPINACQHEDYTIFYKKTTLFYIFIPEEEILSTNCLCANRYRIRTGPTTISVPVERIQLE